MTECLGSKITAATAMNQKNDICCATLKQTFLTQKQQQQNTLLTT